MTQEEGSAQVGKGNASLRVYDIPVLFQVRAEDEDAAASLLANVLGDTDVASKDWLEDEDMEFDREIESYHLPNHKHIDGSDSPVTVTLVIAEARLAERRAIVNEIADTVGIERP